MTCTFRKDQKAEVEESLRNAFESYNQRMGELSILEFSDKPLELEWGRANILEVSANMVTGDKFRAQESSAFDKLRAIAEQMKSDSDRFGKDKPVVITVFGLDIQHLEIEAALEKLAKNAGLKPEDIEPLKNALKTGKIILKSVTEENGLVNKQGKMKGRINALALKNSLPKIVQKITIFALNKDHWDLNGLEEGIVKLLVFLAGGLVQKIEKGVAEDIKRINLIKFQA
ncbi:MAG: hypothetical protein HYT97_09455 [Elusimicrobia bacterium]|nr:hypothetical protein [Elusimicrobiota bacterium]